MQDLQRSASAVFEKSVVWEAGAKGKAKAGTKRKAEPAAGGAKGRGKKA